jgi:hypothetical protein
LGNQGFFCTKIKEKEMASFIPLGRIAGAGEDVFPTTGPHLDVRVTPQFGPQKGKKIDPQTIRSLLQNIVVGKNQTPIVQQQGKDYKFNFPVTSPFGPRSAPTAGASTYHQGIDLGIGPETLGYKGTGTYKPGRGYGTLSTTDPQGNPYDIQFLHTKPGKETSIATASAPVAPTLTAAAPTDTGNRTEDILKAFLYGAGYSGKKEEPKKTFEQGLKEQLLGNVLKEALTPTSFLSSYATSNPFLAGQSAATGDFLGGVFS